MYYSTVLKRTPVLRSYGDAKLRYENTKPIRGRADETIRPLGDRGAVDKYSIRKRGSVETGDLRYECVLYRTPVLTFFENGNVSVTLGGYSTMSTRQFISEVFGFGCSSINGSSVLHINDTYVVMANDKPTVLRKVDGNGFNSTWELVSRAKVTETKLIRKKATEVMQRYKEFRSYMANMIKLRAVDTKYFGPYVNVNGEEMNAQLSGYTNSSPEYALHHLTRSDQPEEGKNDNFYKAFLLLALKTGGISRPTFLVNNSTGHGCVAAKLPVVFREVVYKAHGDEVFEVVEVPIGKVPSKTYEGWNVRSYA